ncbi:structure-specific endonuclease subunit SLX4 isoform X2 [Anthonomus grandis grandis]|uniref:structure-specific endonuclease subunit SLX4 isoform X2 n=1 Tax=Anthonomus grandis grandis TaxID=2921223 RepID=UPI00216511F8|nr:structure-specific endonuclease subunit SLX4 isoform X2 [Anthonomus grandis grandis]
MNQKQTHYSSKPLSNIKRGAKKTKTKSNSQQSNTVSKYFKSSETRKVEDSDDDFRSPIKLKKPVKVAWKLTKEPPKAKTGKKLVKKQSKLVIENFSSDNVNPEHLQMALALSKSEEKIQEDTPDIGAILQNVKPTSLERFGFKGKKVLEGDSWKPRAPQVGPKKGRNRFKYVTPILNMRTSADREQLINSKISLILNQMSLETNKTDKVEIFSERLHGLACNECRLFKFDYASDNFYVSDLNFSRRRFISLLRDWGTIIGREKSPELPKSPGKRSISPDLFASYEEPPEAQEAFSISTNDEIVSTKEPIDENECILISDSSEEPWAARDEEHLNVTDYIKTLLSQDRYSFDNNATATLNSKELDKESIGSEESDVCKNPVKDVNSSQESVLNDEELNYSTRYADFFNCTNVIENLNFSVSSLSPKNGSQESLLNDEELNYSTSRATPSKTRNSIQLSATNDETLIYSLDYSTPIKTLNNEELNYSINHENENFMRLKTSRDNKSSSYSIETLNNEELNYSINQANENFMSPKTSPDDKSSSCSIETLNNEELNYSINNENENFMSPKTSPDDKASQSLLIQENPIETPVNSQYIIKTSDITPMPNYDTMTTPLIVKELDKIGVKPLKRLQGAKLLKYIYDSTHPFVDIDDDRPAKRARLEETKVAIEIVGDKLLENESLIFERRQKAKVKTCKPPLQIVWHNFVCSNPEIRENILLYEPLQLESLHAMLKELGFMFHIQDLLTFLDKKCITVRVAQGQGKRHR